MWLARRGSDSVVRDPAIRNVKHPPPKQAVVEGGNAECPPRSNAQRSISSVALRPMATAARMDGAFIAGEQ